MVGNVFSWSLASVCIFSFVLLSLVHLLCRPRNLFENLFVEINPIFKSSNWLIFLAWAFHFVPLVNGTKTLQDYFMGHFFAILMLGAFLQFICMKLQKAQHVFLASFLVVTIGVYLHLSPITYGLPLTKARCEGLKFFTKKWNIECLE